MKILLLITLIGITNSCFHKKLLGHLHHHHKGRSVPRFNRPAPPVFQQGPQFFQPAAPVQQPAPPVQPPVFLQGPPVLQQGPQFFQPAPPVQPPAPPVFLQGPPVLQQGPQFFQPAPPVFQQGPPVFQQGPPVFQQGPPVQQPDFFQAGVRYTIRAKLSNLLLRAENPLYQGSRVRQYNGARNDASFLWTFERVHEACNQYYIRSVVNPEFFLDIEGVNKNDLANLIVWPKNGGDNQVFIAERQHDGSFRLTARHSHKVLDVQGNNAFTGAQIIQYSWTGADNQRFFIESC